MQADDEGSGNIRKGREAEIWGTYDSVFSRRCRRGAKSTAHMGPNPCSRNGRVDLCCGYFVFVALLGGWFHTKPVASNWFECLTTFGYLYQHVQFCRCVCLSCICWNINGKIKVTKGGHAKLTLLSYDNSWTRLTRSFAGLYFYRAALSSL